MKTPMRSLQDVMSRFPSSISDRFDKEDHGHKKFFLDVNFRKDHRDKTDVG